MTLHDWLALHSPDLMASHWEGGQFVTRCLVCSKRMVKLPGQPWRVRAQSS